MTNQKTIKSNVNFKKGEDPIKKIMEEHFLSSDLWYPYSIKIKDGKWNTAAKKREQDLIWTKETQTKTTDLHKGGQNITKTDNVQIMQGHSKHYPEFMLANNKTYSIEVVFKRLPVEHDILDSFKEVIKDMPKAEIIKPRKRILRNGIVGEMTTFDAHLGKLAREAETGYRDYDLNIAIQDHIYANDANLDLMSKHRPEKIFYILGQDLYHVDNMAGHTTHGNHDMDVDGRITKVHTKTFTVSRDNILKCAKLAPVEVIWIPGNHDYLASYMLAFALKEHFKGDKRISVDISENPRKARLWGVTLVGWTHRIVGRHSTWANELALNFPEYWGKSIFREWHHGDQHKKQQVKAYPLVTSGGVTMRQITALSPVDRWHHENNFNDAIPGGESFMWSKEGGVFANFSVWIGNYNNHRNKLIK